MHTHLSKRLMFKVFLSLLKATHVDHKEIVRKSLDILTPAVPVRMDDGHNQLMTLVKKTIVEDCYSTSQIAHCMLVFESSDLYVKFGPHCAPCACSLERFLFS